MRLEYKSSDIKIKRDCINLVLSISFAISSYIITAKLISLFYKPDIPSILKKATGLLMPALFSYCRPEPLEKIIFITGIILIPVFLFLYFLAFKNILNRKKESSINYIWILICLYTAIIIPFLIFRVMSAPSQYVPPYSYLQVYILNSIVEKNISLLVIIPSIFIIYYLLRIKFSPEIKTFKFLPILFDFIYLSLISYLAALFVFSIYINDNHFDSVFYSIVQLFKGIPLGVEGFTNAYGFYPYFLNFLFKIIGLSVLKCSIVFCFLIAVSFLLILLFLKNTVNNKFIVFLGFLSIVYFSCLSGALRHLKQYGQVLPYYQYLPLRYLFPCLFLLLSALYIKNKNKHLYGLCSIICALSFLWNFDTGVVVVISWILLNFYSEFEQQNARMIFKNILLHTIKIFSIMTTTVLFFYLLVFIFYGKTIDVTALFQTVYVFSALGYGLFPMPLLHPWNLLVLTYIIGIGISIMALIKKDINSWSKNVFLVTIMGTGMLLYYQGRSHDYSIFGPIFYFFILLTLFLDKILSFLKSNRNILLEFLSLLIASILSLSVIFMLINVKHELLILKTSIKNVRGYSSTKQVIQMNSNFIKKHLHPSEKVIILSHNSGTYFSKIPNISAFNPGLSELYLKSDYERLRIITEESDVKIFADRTKETNYVTDILINLEIIDSNGHIFLLKKRSYNN